MYSIEGREYLTLCVFSVWLFIPVGSLTFSQKTDTGFYEFHDHISLGYRSCIERAVVLDKENKIASSSTFRHCRVLEGLIPGLLEKG